MEEREGGVDVNAILERLFAERQAQLDAAVQKFCTLSKGNPGTWVLGKTLHTESLMEIPDLVALAERLGLVGNSLYILHKEFGGKDVHKTSELLAALLNDPEASFPLLSTRKEESVVAWCIAEKKKWDP
jgi:hypothetical protein